jgi:hypothetical protein
MATITVLNEELMSRSGARVKLDQTKEGVGMQPKPCWGLLYALGLLGGVLFIAGEDLFVSAVWQGVWDVAAAGVTLAAIKLWMQANRIALAVEGHADIRAAAGADTTGTPARRPALLAGSKRAA